MERRQIWPMPGKLVRMHDQGMEKMPEEGVAVFEDAQYRRAVARGDCSWSDPRKPAPVKAKKAAPPAPSHSDSKES